MFQQSWLSAPQVDVMEQGRKLGKRVARRATERRKDASRLRRSLPRGRDLRKSLQGMTVPGPTIPRPELRRRARRRMGRKRWLMLASFLGGALTMFLLDPRMGKRRRALFRDKGVLGYHFLIRRLPSATRKRGVWVRDRVRGMGYELRHAVGRDGHRATDDVELAQRVRTEVFRDPAIPDGAVNVDAYEGVVTLRGELPTPEMIHEMVRRTERVEGVRQVRSLLHLPQARAPMAPSDPAMGGDELPRGYDERDEV